MAPPSAKCESATRTALGSSFTLMTRSDSCINASCFDLGFILNAPAHSSGDRYGTAPAAFGKTARAAAIDTARTVLNEIIESPFIDERERFAWAIDTARPSASIGVVDPSFNR